MDALGTRWYSKYTAKTVVADGVATPESDMTHVKAREQIIAHMIKYKYVYVVAGHPVIDLIKYSRIVDNLDAYDVSSLGLYRVARNVFDWCIEEIKECLATIKVQRWWRAVLWRTRMPPLNNAKEFGRSTMGNSLPTEIFRAIVAQYFKQELARPARQGGFYICV